ncbi:MAG: YceI family protein [Chloroflexota bacterium]
MSKQQPTVPMRFVSLAVCLLLMGLVSACAMFGDAEQPTALPTTAPSTATRAPVTASPTAQAVTTTTAGAPTAPPAATNAPATTTNGAQTVRVELVAGDNEARYRVREQLARVSFPSDAVGATKAVTGTIVAKPDGTIVSTESKFQVDLSTLKSDENQRDNFIKRDTLQTNRYPYAVFVPTKIEGLTLPLPTTGDVSFKLIGDLTIRNVTKPVTWDVKGTLNGNDAKGTATTSFTWDYFNLSKPNVFTVLSVEDTIKLELDLHLRRVAAP